MTGDSAEAEAEADIGLGEAEDRQIADADSDTMRVLATVAGSAQSVFTYRISGRARGVPRRTSIPSVVIGTRHCCVG